MPVWLGCGVLAAVLLYAGLRWFANARAGDIAHALRTFAAVFSALASTGLVFSHRFGFAIKENLKQAPLEGSKKHAAGRCRARRAASYSGRAASSPAIPPR